MVKTNRPARTLIHRVLDVPTGPSCTPMEMPELVAIYAEAYNNTGSAPEADAVFARQTVRVEWPVILFAQEEAEPESECSTESDSCAGPVRDNVIPFNPR
jgi:hypothetical protein